MRWEPIETAPRDGRPVWVEGHNWGDPDCGIHRNWAWWDGSGWREAGGEGMVHLKYLTRWFNPGG